MISASLWRSIFHLLALLLVEGAYLPNYGYVGCYLERMIRLLNINYTTKDMQFSRHRCIQQCLNDSYSYAAFTKGNICYCISDYNQTFAVDQKKCDKNCVPESQYKCGSTDKVTVFNTMYDMKPLLAIPGSDSFFVSLWNSTVTGRFNQTFNGPVFRNPDIDRWKRKQKYYKPEFVSLVAFNQFGQDIWSVDFNTNDTLDGSLHRWMKTENILSDSYNGQQVNISIKNGTVKLFEDQSMYLAHGSFLPEGRRVTIVTPNKRPHKVYKWLPGNCTNMTSWTDVEPPLDVGYSKPFSFCKANNSSDYVLVEVLGYKTFEQRFEFNFNAKGMTKFKLYHLIFKERYKHYHDDHGEYNNEEPKRSKWEFLNDLPMEEIINIMRPHISKSKAEGTVPKRNISANVRKKESAGDRRTSSKGLGALGGSILCFVFLLLFIADIPTFKQQLSACFSRLLR